MSTSVMSLTVITATLWFLTLLAFAGLQIATSTTDYKYFFNFIQGNYSCSSSGAVTSPGFPLRHPTSSSHIYFYELEHLGPHGRIKVVFTDFFLDSVNKSVNMCNDEQNYLKIIDGKKSSRYCSFKRPAPHLSSTHNLRFEYHLNGKQRHHGYGVFSLNYSFITLQEAEEFERGLRGGSYVQNTAYEVANIGHVSINILRANTEWVDYLWYLRGRPGNRLLLNFLAVSINASGSLEVRDGSTSQAPLLLLVQGNSTDVTDVLSTQATVYVHWHGHVSQYNRLRFVYSNVAPEEPQVS
ncbi:uncharacterized protein LOC119732658 [Patiria miniata]|uniref:CUB domain-containing protein n=1 Tax=Patiria miniata TaxID=46514 RepID=A0A914AER1_PATMI|nr:uncharacterized protein LOC119732658 [Patiria miniata]XP_038062214.1 uncharacterized protein LOC119732658 [Patiria miniata]